MSIRLMVLAAVLLSAVRLTAETVLMTFGAGGCFEGDGARASAMAEDLTRRAPSVAVITDAVGATASSLPLFAKRYGHGYAVLSRAPGRPFAVTASSPVEVVAETPFYMHVTVDGKPLMAVQLSPYGALHRCAEARAVRDYLVSKKLIGECPVVGDFGTTAPADEAALTDYPGSFARAAGPGWDGLSCLDSVPVLTLMGASLYDALPVFVPRKVRMADASVAALPMTCTPAEAGLRTAHVLLSANLCLRQTGAELVTSDKSSAYAGTLPVSVTLK